uniref:hypothetical protein n=1 Tax=Mitsuokella multacida TaxID=52226 RepID=UPI004024C421
YTLFPGQEVFSMQKEAVDNSSSENHSFFSGLALRGRLFAFTAIWQESRILIGKDEIYKSELLKDERGYRYEQGISGQEGLHCAGGGLHHRHVR